jgi:hypothetical protein
VSGSCRKQNTALADYLDLTRLLISVLGGRNGKHRAIKDYKTIWSDDFPQLGELAFWVCENGNHKATRTLNNGHLEMLSIQKASRQSDFDFANWVDVGRHAKPRNGTRLMMYPVASVNGGVFTKGSLRHGCPTELGKVHVPAKFCSILVGHTPNRRPLKCSCSSTLDPPAAAPVTAIAVAPPAVPSVLAERRPDRRCARFACACG